MKIYHLVISIFLLSFTGCKKDSFDIYRELEISDFDIKKNQSLSFLENIVVGGISYKDDKLTPDLIDGRLFEDRNLTKVKITRYFIYNKNRTFDHHSSIFVDLNPKMVLYIKNYFSEKDRIKQIINCKIPVFPTSKNKNKKNINCANDNNDFLPKGLLPPRLPDLSIGVDTPNIPGI